jgi:hypothetical protein
MQAQLAEKSEPDYRFANTLARCPFLDNPPKGD